MASIFFIQFFLLVGARGCSDQSARRLLHGLAAPGSGDSRPSNGSATQLAARQHRRERLDFIEEEKSFERLMVSLKRDRSMTRIAQPEQMAAAELETAAGDARVQKNGGEHPACPPPQPTQQPLTTTLPGNKPKLPDKIIHCTAPRFDSRTAGNLRAAQRLTADPDFFQQRRCHSDLCRKSQRTDSKPQGQSE
jgi:hypothetical protein